MREALADYMRHLFQQQATVYALASRRGTMRSLTGDVRRDAALLLEQERQRLTAAELFYVTEDMARLAVAAAETLPVHSLHPEDVPAECGFVVFAEPIGAYVPDAGPSELADVVTIVAASWACWRAWCLGTRACGSRSGRPPIPAATVPSVSISVISPPARPSSNPAHQVEGGHGSVSAPGGAGRDGMCERREPILVDLGGSWSAILTHA